MRSRIKLAFSLALIFILVSSTIFNSYGGMHFGPISAVKSKIKELKEKKEKKERELQGIKYTLAPNAVILSQQTVVQQLKSQEGDTYRFDAQATEIGDRKAGDIIISTNGEGFLRKITSISNMGNEYVVQTTTATLEEAFENLNIEFSRELTTPDLKPMQYLPQGVNFKTSLNGFSFNFDNVGNCPGPSGRLNFPLD